MGTQFGNGYAIRVCAIYGYAMRVRTIYGYGHDIRVRTIYGYAHTGTCDMVAAMRCTIKCVHVHE